jgi:hypothetical protein
METKIEYAKKSSKSDLDYFKQVLCDAERLSISVRWRFDEQQADAFHRFF